MSLASTEYPKGVNEFVKAGFTMIESDLVRPFRVAESPVQFECRVNDIIHLGDQGGAGNLIICEVLRMHISEAVLDKNSKIDQQKLDLVARAGGALYSRANAGFFEIPKPISTLGIGIDQIPEEIRTSTILTGNNLGVLGNVESLPNEQDVDNFVADNPVLSGLNRQEKHIFAKEYLENNDVESAWKVLLIKE